MPHISNIGAFSATERADISVGNHAWTIPVREVYIECGTAGTVTLHWAGDAAGMNRVYTFAAGDRWTFVGVSDMVVRDAGSDFAGVIEGHA